MVVIKRLTETHIFDDELKQVKVLNENLMARNLVSSQLIFLKFNNV
jgi:hypothetical protein